MHLAVVALVAWLLAHVIKFCLEAFRGNVNFRSLYKSGGMPSGHASTVTAVAVAALMLEGLQSPVFGLAAVLAAIVIYDTLGVRRSSGEQSLAINKMIKKAGDTQSVKEVLGHSPKEVLVGMVLGALVGLSLTFSVWVPVTDSGVIKPAQAITTVATVDTSVDVRPLTVLSYHSGTGGGGSSIRTDSQYTNATWMTTVPSEHEKLAYLIAFALIIFAGIASRALLTRYYKTATIKRLVSASWWSFVSLGLLGLFFSLLQYQSVGGATWRLWAILLLGAFIGVQVILYLRLYRYAPSNYQSEVKQLMDKKGRKQQYNKRKKNKKSSKAAAK